MIPGARRMHRPLAALAVIGLLGLPHAAAAQEVKGAAPGAPPAGTSATAPASGAAPASAAAPAPAPAPTGAPARWPAPPTERAAWVIPAAAGPGVYALVPPRGQPLGATPFTTKGVDIQQGRIEVCFKDAGRGQCLSLLHPSAATEGDERTRHFAVRAPAGTDPALLAAAVASIKKNERASLWVAAKVPAAPAAPEPLSPPPPRSRRTPYVVVGFVALLVGLWLVARAAQGRGLQDRPGGRGGAATVAAGAMPGGTEPRGADDDATLQRTRADLEWAILIPVLGAYLAGLAMVALPAKQELILAYFDETGPIEIGTVGALLATLTYACRRGWHALRAGNRAAFAFGCLAAAALAFGAGEEVAWGQKLLEYATPDGIFKRFGEHGEVTLHNMKVRGVRFNTIVSFSMLGVLFVYYAFGRMIYDRTALRRHIDRFDIPVPQLHHALIALGIVVSQAIGLEHELWRGEEITEFAGSWLLLCVFFNRYNGQGPHPPPSAGGADEPGGQGPR
jgi:hypothetical protein